MKEHKNGDILTLHDLANNGSDCTYSFKIVGGRVVYTDYGYPDYATGRRVLATRFDKNGHYVCRSIPAKTKVIIIEKN